MSVKGAEDVAKPFTLGGQAVYSSVDPLIGFHAVLCEVHINGLAAFANRPALVSSSCSFS